MKKLLLLLVCLPALAQTSFKTEDKNIVWQGVFSADNANIAAVLDKDPNLKVGVFMDNMYKGAGAEIENTCDGGTALMKNKIKFEFVILTDPNGYVVKVKNLKIIEKFGPMQARTVASPAEKYFMASGALKTDTTAQTNMSCLNNFFTSLFSPLPESAGTALTSN